jgi:hypothetical protein
MEEHISRKQLNALQSPLWVYCVEKVAEQFLIIAVVSEKSLW